MRVSRWNAGQVGFVFQHPILYPHLSVRKNILFQLPCAATAKRSIKNYYTDLMDALQIGELQHRKPQELSGGQAQRVGIARASFAKHLWFFSMSRWRVLMRN